MRLELDSYSGTTAMLSDFCEWLESLMGTTIRGRTVVDIDAFIQGDKSARITVTVSGKRKTFEEMIFEGNDDDELNWHMVDVTKYRDIEPVWEYWDEFAERDHAEQRTK